MAPPLQVAVLGFLTGIAFLEYGLGVHAVVPHLYAGFGNASLLKSKLVTSQRNEILGHFRVLAKAPLFVPVVVLGAWVVLVVAALFNAATDAQKRGTHVATLLAALVAVVPAVAAFIGPAASIAKTGKAKLAPAQEVQALYDISLAIAVAGFLFFFALIQNLTADEADEAAPKKKKKEKKETKDE
ncbi:hypothetical protein HDU79_001129 [Rhizoclosmatium sp. JEL0117]|nr:hypothetical protein HDU99_005437 [Rhizoclosmatium hyalinum]KAJ3292735.1 hypothetical protein HDU79_001129 [Rhizoclosmatium sp. JEL0117]